MKTKQLWLASLLFAAALLTGINVHGQDVYIAGTKMGADTHGTGVRDNHAALWKNGVMQKLETSRGYVESIYVSGNDVYVLGSQEREGADGSRTNVEVFWKNGVAHELSDSRSSTSAKVIFVSGDDVYVAGNEMTDWPFRTAVLWKNGEKQYLPAGDFTEALVKSLYVSGDDVYVAGLGYYINSFGNSTAILWKNGELQCLSDSSRQTVANAVFVSGNDVYVAGCEYGDKPGDYEEYDAVVWKNGVIQKLYEDGTATSIFVSGNDIYVAGHVYENEYAGEEYGYAERVAVDHKEFATFWKNGVAQNLNRDGKMSTATSMCVSGTDVYIVGYEKNVDDRFNLAIPYSAILWKNGKSQLISMDAEAYCVFVK